MVVEKVLVDVVMMGFTLKDAICYNKQIEGNLNWIVLNCFIII